jgi:dTDP-4-amino-4,6-dideoxygalactose transaminase
MNNGNGIPFLDLVTPHLELETELVDAVRNVITSAMFIGGPAVEGFEREFAEFCQSKYCIAVNSGTDALRFALMAAGIGPGDIVVTVPNTFAATVEAILQAGATPQFVDVDPETSNMSAEALRTHLRVHAGEPIKAIMPVHLYGQMCDMDAIMDIAQEHGLMVFEDACQAHGSEYLSKKENRWLKAGSIGKAAGFSFYPGKNLGACGEGGAVTTDDEALAQRVRMIRDHGQNKKYHHLIEGYNGRLDAMQAAILRIKLPHLRKWNENRRKAAENYNQLLKGVAGVKPPSEPRWSRGIYHLYVVRAQQRDEVQKHLTELNIGTGLHYPIPLHLQKAYEHLGYSQGDFPVTEQLARELLSLPMFPHIQREQQAQVVEALAAREVLR